MSEENQPDKHGPDQVSGKTENTPATDSSKGGGPQKEQAPKASATANAVSHAHRISPWRWPLTFMVLGFLAFAAYWITVSETTSLFKSGKSKIRDISEKASIAAGTFSSSQISQSFLSQLPARIEEGGNHLEVANFESVETFRSESQKRIAWDYVDLGTSVAEIRVPVTYRYHIQLEDDWQMTVHDNVCFVTAPKLRPTQPPAIHTHRMEKFTARGLLRFDSNEGISELTRSITPTVRMYAGDSQHIALVKDSARKGVARFVQKWLLDNGYWATNRVNRIIVAFPDEVAAEPTLLPASTE
jgi:hypothetical protein